VISVFVDDFDDANAAESFGNLVVKAVKEIKFKEKFYLQT
jgi:hypothetical protein